MEKQESVRKQSMKDANPAGTVNLAIPIARSVANSLDRIAGRRIATRSTVVREALEIYAKAHDAEYSAA